MIDAKVLTIGFDAISKKMSENRMHLISIDQQIGDGDLGISMDNGFKAAADVCCANADTADIGKLLFLAGKSFNEAAPSSLGTIVSMLLIDAAKQLKGTEVIALADFGNIIHMVIAIVATAWAFQFVSWSFELWPTTPIYKLPLALSRLSIIVSFILMSIYVLIHLIRSVAILKGGEN